MMLKRMFSPLMTAVCLVLVSMGRPAFAGEHHDRLHARQQEVTAKGAQVMPFDLAKTRHVFDDRPNGGVQTVVAQHAGDVRQVRLIRQHLREEARHFQRGDFTDPARIHGQHMPGLAALSAGRERIRITYQAVPGGARLVYASHDPETITAIHEWFAAQRLDHRAHGHEMPKMHGAHHH